MNRKTNNKYNEAIVDPARSPAEIQDIYDTWAAQYDTSMEEDDYNGPKVALQAIQNAGLKRDARILDIGVGTGLVGDLLLKNGYNNFDGIEPNGKMLDKARKRNIYKRLIQDFVGKNKLDVKNGTYDAVVGAGVFVPGHISEEAFDELHRITKPGGYVIIISSERYNDADFQGYGQRLSAGIRDLESRGLWKCEKQELMHYHDIHHAYVFYLVVQ